MPLFPGCPLLWLLVSLKGSFEKLHLSVPLSSTSEVSWVIIFHEPAVVYVVALLTTHVSCVHHVGQITTIVCGHITTNYLYAFECLYCESPCCTLIYASANRVYEKCGYFPLYPCTKLSEEYLNSMFVYETQLSILSECGLILVSSALWHQKQK